MDQARWASIPDGAGMAATSWLWCLPTCWLSRGGGPALAPLSHRPRGCWYDAADASAKICG